MEEREEGKEEKKAEEEDDKEKSQVVQTWHLGLPCGRWSEPSWSPPKAEVDLGGVSLRTPFLRGVRKGSKNTRRGSDVVTQQPGAPAFFSDTCYQTTS